MASQVGEAREADILMRTQYEQAQGSFSYSAHLAAREQIYPLLFASKDITYEDVRMDRSYRGKVLDGEMGVDVVIRSRNSSGKFSDRLPFFVQERFRRPSFGHYANITITEFNHASDQASELHKIAAGVMVYGLFDEDVDVFTAAFAVDVARLMLYLQHDAMPFERRTNKKAQSFICLKFSDLHKASCLLWRLKSPSAGQI